MRPEELILVHKCLFHSCSVWFAAHCKKKMESLWQKWFFLIYRSGWWSFKRGSWIYGVLQKIWKKASKHLGLGVNCSHFWFWDILNIAYTTDIYSTPPVNVSEGLSQAPSIDKCPTWEKENILLDDIYYLLLAPVFQAKIKTFVTSIVQVQWKNWSYQSS